MQAGEEAALRDSIRSHTLLRRLLIAAGAILGVWYVFFVVEAPVVLAPLSRHQAPPELATAELRSFPVLAAAPGVLQLRSGTNFVVRAPFSQTEDAQIAHGQPAVVTVDAIPGLSLRATVSTIEASATQVGGVPEYYAEIGLSQSDPRLRNGQTGSVSVTIANATNVLSIPSTALFTGQNNATQVDVWQAGQVYATTVTIGLVGSNLAQITSGLQAGEQVMLSPSGQTLATSPRPT
jgi:HlyD family secretion protein